jgi:hypothetical protein
MAHCDCVGLKRKPLHLDPISVGGVKFPRHDEPGSDVDVHLLSALEGRVAAVRRTLDQLKELVIIFKASNDTAGSCT